jgi:(p)ppGpp synthase/HD superfamily hydrolase
MMTSRLPGGAPLVPNLEDAIALAVQAHRGQLYPSPVPEPYVLHPLRVMLRLESETERIVGVLHDVVEDTDVTLDDLRRLGYSDEIVDAVDHLTQRPGDAYQGLESYDAYIERLISNPIARRVKLADLADNHANNRHLEPTPVTKARIARYRRARRQIQAAIRADRERISEA